MEGELREITVATIAAAERLMGVEYSAAERQQMLDNLEGQIASAVARRAVAMLGGRAVVPRSGVGG